MPIYDESGVKLRPYIGDRHPVNIYKGSDKLAGWVNETKTGESIDFDGTTYNDTADVVVSGNTVQKSDWYAKDGLTTLSADYYGKDGLTTLVADYYGKDGLTTLAADWHGESGLLSQVQTVQGKNLIDFSKLTFTSMTSTGIITRDTQWVQYKDVAGNYGITSNSINVVPNTDYTIQASTFVVSGTSDVPSGGLRIKFIDTNTYTDIAYASYIPFNSGSNTQIKILMYIGCPMTKDAEVRWTNLQLELGTVATTYEHCIPISPSPDYPSEVYLAPTGKNLFDTAAWDSFITKTQTNTYVPNTKGTDGEYNYIGVHPGNGHYLSRFMFGRFAQNSQYTISFWARQESVKTGVTTGFRFYYTDGTYSNIYADNTTNWGKYILTSLPNKTILYIAIPYYYGGYVWFSNIQLEVGTTASDYEPCKTIAAGNYKIADPSGGYWLLNLADDLRGIDTYKDKIELDLQTGKGKIRKNIGKKIFDGTEDIRYWAQFSNDTHDSFYFVNSSLLGVYGSPKFTGSSGFVTHFKSGSVANQSTTENCYFFYNAADSPYFSFRLARTITGVTSSDDSATKITKMKSWFTTLYSNGNPVTVFYKFIAESVTPITLSHAVTSDYAELTLADLGITIQAPDYPYNLVTNLPAGTYKYTSTDGIYEFTLVDELRSISSSIDKVVFDRVSHKGYIEVKNGVVTLDGTEDWYVGTATYDQPLSTARFTSGALLSKISNIATDGNSSSPYEHLCTHTPFKSSSWATDCGNASCRNANQIHIRFLNTTLGVVDGTDNEATRTSKFKAYIASQYNAGTPVKFSYKLKTPTYTPITFTKVASSDKTEVPMTFLNVTAQSPTCPFTLSTNLASGTYKYTSNDGIYEFTLPEELRGVGTAIDKIVFDRISHKAYLDRYCSYKILDGTESWTLELSGTGYIECYTWIATKAYGATCASNIACSHFIPSNNVATIGGIAGRTNNRAISICVPTTIATTVAELKTWLANQKTVGTPVVIYYELQNRTRTSLSFTKVASSTQTEVPMTYMNIIDPSPDYPFTMNTNLAAGTYKYTSNDGIYEFTLPEELRGVDTTYDKVVFDRISHKAYLEKNCSKLIYNGIESWEAWSNSVSGYYDFVQRTKPSPDPIVSLSSETIGKILCSHFNPINVLTTSSGILVHSQEAFFWTMIRIPSYLIDSYTASAMQSWLSSNPVSVYYKLKNPTRIPLTITKVASSTKTEVPLTFLTTTPSLNYPAEVWNVSGNIKSRGKNLWSLPSYCYCHTGAESNINPGGGFLFPITKHGTYTLSADITRYPEDTVDIPRITLRFVYEDGTVVGRGGFYGQIPADGVTRHVYITCPSDSSKTISKIGGWIFDYTLPPSFRHIEANNIQLEYNSTVTSYEPYKTPTNATLPTLRKIGSIVDTYNPKTGVLTKNISDWNSLSGMTCKPITYAPVGSHRMDVGSYPNVFSEGEILLYDYESILIPKSPSNNYNRVIPSTWTYNDGFVRLIEPDTRTGFSPYPWMPTGEDIKAYFYGWIMCNADGTSPYYKSEVPYTPNTWAEWTVSDGSSVTKDASGITLTSSGNGYCIISIPMNFKANTKYGFLYNIISTNITSNLMCRGWSSPDCFTQQNLSHVVGNNKHIVTTNATLSSTKIGIHTDVSEAAGNVLKVKDFRIFELPPGSQIETDFANLTPDQLAAKYTYNGLCTKNWKHVTDGLGQTATLPTATYDGYTPYKMIYQLATPVVTTLTASPLSTYYPTTIIETDSVSYCKPIIEATAKIED